MTDTSKVERTVEVDESQELSKREMLDVTGGGFVSMLVSAVESVTGLFTNVGKEVGKEAGEAIGEHCRPPDDYYSPL